MSARRVLCVVGPTAVGKSDIAESVALCLHGQIVSVDSMQVYVGMDIGTAKVAEDSRRCPLHMVDVVEVNRPYSVSQFQADARRCVDDLLAADVVPVLCGGTGLYLDAVIDKMEFPHGETNGKGREPYERIAKEEGAEALHQLLASRDARSASIIHPNNVRRVVRALEMLDEGVSYAKQHEGLLARPMHYDATIWALVLPREELYERINRRVDQMFEQGLVKEVQDLRQRGLESSITAQKAIGYKEVLLYLQGHMTLEQAQEAIKKNTRRYAKRQLSWIRRDGRARVIDLSTVSSDEATRMICEDWRTA